MQKTLDFDTVPHNGTATSKAGAAAVRSTAAEQNEAVYRFIASRGEYGATNHEIQAATGLPVNIVTRAANTLWSKEPYRTKQNGTRKGPCGVANKVWVAR